VACGIVAHVSGLFNPFIGDDTLQIVVNTPLHSLGNFTTFLGGSTFYTGDPLHPLAGAYYRPMQTVTYSLVYTLFGPTPFAFHAVQLAIAIGSTVFLYLILQYWFKPLLALVFSLVFLLHPIDAAGVFFIAAMSDALFFFFGILALWLVMRFRGTMSLALSAGCLFLSLLSKETGILFVPLILLYLLMFDRPRLYRFGAFTVIPVTLWLILRAHAVGLSLAVNDATIAATPLAGRLMTMPSIMAFYLAKLVWPIGLASGYYWVHPNFSFTDFVLPLTIDLAVIAAAVYAGLLVRKRASTFEARSYVFFAVWCTLGLLAHIQIIPLDMTASNQWFMFAMPGLVGMVGTGFCVLKLPSVRLDRSILTGLVLGALVVGGFRTGLRGLDLSSDYSVALTDLQSAPQDYTAYVYVSTHLASEGDLAGAKAYAQKSLSIFPYEWGYYALGDADYRLQDYADAEKAYDAATSYGGFPELTEKAALVRLWYGTTADGEAYIARAIAKFPRDAALWEYLAILQDKSGDSTDAKISITKAYGYDQSAEVSRVYSDIIDNRPFKITP